MRNHLCILTLFILITVSTAQAQYAYTISYFGQDTSLKLTVTEGLPQHLSGRYRAYDGMKYRRNGFEQNKLLSIKNIGTRPIENLRFSVNENEFVYTYKELLDKIDLSGLASIDDTLKTLYKFISDWHIPSGMVSTNGVNGGSNWIRKIQSYNVFGAGDCGNNSQILRGMLTALGYEAKVVMLQNYHAVVFVFSKDGRTIFLDGLYRGLYTNRYNDSLADISTMLDDADIIRRQRHLGIEIATSFPYDYMTRAFTGNCWRVPLFLTDDIDSINLVIKPNEEYRFLYDTPIPDGRHSYFNDALPYPTYPPPPTAAKGEQITNVLPDSTAPLVVLKMNDIKLVQSDTGLRAQLDSNKLSGSLLLQIQNPFVITDADILYKAEFGNTGRMIFNYSRDTTSWQTVQTSWSEQNDVPDSVNLFPNISPQDLPMLNCYYLQVIFERDSLNEMSPLLSSLKIKTVFQFNPNAIPKLDFGENIFKLETSNNEDVHIQFQMLFEPVKNVSPPKVVQAPVFPQNGQNLLGSKFAFKWQFPSSAGVTAITDYRVQVSDRSDFKTVVSSTFDHFGSTIEQSLYGVFQIPQSGLLQPQKKYYWRVSYRRNDGIWSNWSDGWNFTVTSPKPPRLVIDKLSSEEVIIKAISQSTPNASERYILRGSNKVGFQWDEGVTVDTLNNDNIHINGRDTGRIFSFYRAVSIDSRDVESGPSDPLPLGYGNFLINKDDVNQDEKTNRIGVIAPEAYLEWLTFEGTVQIDTFKTTVTSVKMPRGFVYDGTKAFVGIANIGDSMCVVQSSVTAPVAPQNIFFNTPYENQVVDKQFVLHIRHNNLPTFVSDPELNAREDSMYSYKASATDKDSSQGDDVIRYRLLSPSWLSVDTLTGLITGPPRLKNLSDTIVDVEAYDLWGGIAEQRFTLRVQHVNHAPNIISSPVTISKEDTAYAYKVLASDVDTSIGDAVHFKLLVHPQWLTLDTVTGYLRGKPGRKDIGDTMVVIAVEDNYNAQAHQSFNLHVLQSYFPPSSVVTVSPGSDDIVSFSSEEMTFIWNRPPSYYHNIWYSFHLQGPGFDTTIRNIYDTTIALKLGNHLRETDKYKWWVVVRDGRSRVLPEEASCFYVKSVTTAADNFVIPKTFKLWQNFPNAFNSQTSIRFGIPENSRVYIDVLNIFGQPIVKLQQGEFKPGTYTIRWSPQKLAAGIYILRMEGIGMISGKKYYSTIKMQCLH